MRRGLTTAGAIVALAAGLTYGRPAVAQGPRDAPTASPASAQRPMHDFMRRAWGRMTGEDRAALFEAHLAALHVGLKLTAEQEKLWPPLEDALRDCARTIVEHRKAALEGPPADPVAGLRTMADRLTSTGAALRKVAAAAEPLYATLADDQKRRLPILLHGLRPPHIPLPNQMQADEPQGEVPPPIGWGLPE